MAQRVFGLCCRGEKYPVNIEHPVDFSWQLEGCKKQKEVVFRLYEGDTLVGEYRRKSRLQRFTLPQNVTLKPLAVYSYEITAITDAYTFTSERAKFRAGLVHGFSSCARWIGNGSRYVSESDAVGTPAVYLYKSFSLTHAPRDAVVHLCGLGLYELHLNGKRVGDRVLEPAFSQYDKRVLVSAYEVTEYLQAGENKIEVILGDGWYNQATRDTWGFYQAGWRDMPKLLFEMHCDGTVIVSDKSWQTSDGAIVSNALRAGERWNLCTQSFARKPVAQTAPPGGILSPAFLPPIRECERIAPVCSWETESGVVYDFGKSMAGYCVAVLETDKETAVEFTYSDRLTNGLPDNGSNGMYIFNPNAKVQTDEFLLPPGVSHVKPKFVYHGFRYVLVRGQACVKEICALFVHTDLAERGSFSCSSPILNALYSMGGNAILSNYHAFPTDCPHREKNGWTGDAQLSLEACLYRYDMREAYRKWADDFIDNMRESGQISAIIPSCGWGYNWGSGPAWDVAMFRIPYALWYYYGDEITARKMLPYLKKYFAYISAYADSNGLLCVGLGDWNYPKNISFAVCPTELTDSGYYYAMAKILSELCKAFAPVEAAQYDITAIKTACGIRAKYGAEKSLTGLAALTYFGILDKSAEVATYLEQNDCVPHFGILGAKFVLDTLGKSGRSDLGLRLLERTEYPSFGYWVEKGQTALCEDFELTNSLNHHMYSPVCEYMSRYLCGLRVGKNMESAEIVPNLPSGLNAAQTYLDTVYGRYEVRLARVPEGVRVWFTVPCNAYVVYRQKKYSAGEYTFLQAEI